MKTKGTKRLSILFTAWLIGPWMLLAQSDNGNPTLLTLEGKVEISRVGSTQWSPANTNLSLQFGDRLRTGVRSRATVQFSDLSTLRVNELTTFVIRLPSAVGKRSQLDVESGSTFFLSRERPTDVEFRTPLTSGAIRGTEFHLFVADTGRTIVTLLDGAISLTNTFGGLDIASGEQATVEPGAAPVKTAVINAINIIQWCLYYPAVIDLPDLRLTTAERQDLVLSIEAYQAGDLLGALANYPTNRVPQSNGEKIYFAQLLLAVGQVEQAEAQLNTLQPPLPLANALREVIAAVRFQTWNDSSATTSAEHLADSYYFQSRSRLEDALKAAQQAVEQSPDFGFAWARVAELEFSFGRVSAANKALDKALELSPRNAEAVALKGFLLAAKNKYSEASDQFDRAISLDGGLGNAWLGRGLVRIHSGDANAGRRDLQVAATLEPQRAVLRSYLGKAFGNAGDTARANKELKLAEKIDPNDPTSWLYAALLNQQENLINDAVRSLETSQSLNENRSVYRSKMLLDQDRAVRGANLANIYRDNGMTDVSVREAVKAVNSDYANYSAHLFLANSFYDLLDPNRINLRYETPYVSEYLLANLLAPVGAGTLSQQISQNEYSKLFQRDGLNFSSSTEYFSHGDWRQMAAANGTYGNTSFALEESYDSTHGYRPNSDLEERAFDVRFKQQLSSKDSVYFQANFANSSGGNLIQYYNQSTAALSPFRFEDDQTPILLAGYHHEWSPGIDTLLLASRLSDTYSVVNPSQPSFLLVKDVAGGPITGILPFVASERYRSSLEIYSVELQQIWQTHAWTTIAGSRFQFGDFDTRNLQQVFDVSVIDLFPQTTIAHQNVNARFERENIYAYEQWQALDSLKIIGGLSYDWLTIPENFRYSPVSSKAKSSDHLLPKAGLIWTPFTNTTFRAAYSESVSGASFDQSFQLEPSQVAGFNQAYRSLIPEAMGGANAGEKFQIYGASLEHKLPTETYLAVEASLLKSKVQRENGAFEYNDMGGPFLSSLSEKQSFREASLAFSAHQLIGRDLALGAVYRISEAKLKDSYPEISTDVAQANSFTAQHTYESTLRTLELQANYQHPSGFFGILRGSWTQQDDSGYTAHIGNGDYWQCDVLGGYRLLKRHAEITFGILNLTDSNYHLSPLNLYEERPRERTFYTQVRFHF